MRIYAVADMHGRTDRFQKIAHLAAKNDVDLIVAAGDVTSWRSGARVLSMLEQMPVPVLAVKGNSDRRLHDVSNYRSVRVSWLDLERLEFMGVSFAGISGTFLLPFDSRLCFFEKKLVERAVQVVSGASVLIAHPPPRGVADRVFGRIHSGSAGLRKIALRTDVPLIVCGHVHEDPGASWLNKTLVVNCSMGKKGNGALIDYTPGGSPNVRMLL